MIVLYRRPTFDESAYGEESKVIKIDEKLISILSPGTDEGRGLALSFQRVKVYSEESFFDLFGFTTKEYNYYDILPSETNLL